MRTAEDIVRGEVLCCMSSIVSTLASGAWNASGSTNDLQRLAEQALELACPIDDWEEAAIQEGWNKGTAAWSNIPNPENYWGKDGETESAGNVKAYVDAKELCEAENIEPYQREVYEHWAVSDWLGRQLAARGEKVDFDFGNLTVWARTTTGQAISIDSVIESIAADLHRESDS
jgi:hypothetical protein